MSLENRLKKAKKNKEGKSIVSKGVLSKIKIMNSFRKSKIKNPKSQYRKARAILKDQGFEKLKIVNSKLISAFLDGVKFEGENLVMKMREMGLNFK